MRNSRTLGIDFSRLLVSAIALAVAGLGIWLATDLTSGHGTCRTHHEYRVYDGTHDGDGDGVGCETLSAPPGDRPSSSSSTSSTSSASGGRYDRDNWSFNSSSARATLMCDSTEHVDHIVALKEAYDSGAANWTNARKRQFANDLTNLWCLNASVNISKSDHDLAEWSGGSCNQRRHIATVTVRVKSTYGLSTDPAEANAISSALAASCTASTPTQSTPTPQSSSTPSTSSSSESSATSESPAPPTPDESAAIEEPGNPFPAGRIVARRVERGRTEFGYRVEGGSIVLPRGRFLPASAPVGRWLNSTPVEVDGQSIGKISARLLEDGRIEFSFVPTDGERFLPRSRFFPVRSSGQWLASTLIDLDG